MTELFGILDSKWKFEDPDNKYILNSHGGNVRDLEILVLRNASKLRESTCIVFGTLSSSAITLFSNFGVRIAEENTIFVWHTSYFYKFKRDYLRLSEAQAVCNELQMMDRVCTLYGGRIEQDIRNMAKTYGALEHFTFSTWTAKDIGLVHQIIQFNELESFLNEPIRIQ